ncbi:hypothetical protein [Fusobacterium massiliense]|uniref:hypothetical protein n=1 Tax=Fusobacterium massiliense TaxID=1852365 RepID=UPI0028EEB0F5|nr:hypothetical protein [Fusobacterium massiliense]
MEKEKYEINNFFKELKLIPKLYLSKNTLKSIVEEQGNIIKSGGNFVVNNASIVDNSGKIIAKN